MFIFFFNDTATTEIYTLSLHDALPIWGGRVTSILRRSRGSLAGFGVERMGPRSSCGRCPTDRKSTRLNSSHANISYAVFCLKKKNKHHDQPPVGDPAERVNAKLLRQAP